MTKGTKRIIAGVIAAVLLLGAGAYRIWEKLSYDEAVFGRAYGININLYASFFASYFPDAPSYRLSKDGVLYDLRYEDGVYRSERMSDKLRPIVLTRDNFDALLGNSWTAYGIDAQSAREHNKAAWVSITDEGRLYYIMLQDNGDVFLCLGGVWQTEDGTNKQSISMIMYLNDLGPWEDVLAKRTSK